MTEEQGYLIIAALWTICANGTTGGKAILANIAAACFAVLAISRLFIGPTP